MEKLFVPRKKDTDAVVTECIRRGMPRIKHMFRAYQGIHDENDQLSDFLYGVALGLKKVKHWRMGDPIEFLVRNGIYYLRTRKFRAFQKKFIIRCECGKRLKMSQKPCHGTMETRSVDRLEYHIDFADPLAVQNSRGLLGVKTIQDGFGDWQTRHAL